MTPTKEAKTFYSMLALIKSAGNMADYLYSSKIVTFGVKHELKLFFTRFKILQDKMTAHLPVEDKLKWQEDWNRDYECFASVLNMMSEMTDEQRADLENYANQLLK